MNKSYTGTWAPPQMQYFTVVKLWICNTLLKTTLAYCNCTKSIVIQTNTSEYSISTALVHNGRPITFASKTLTDIKSRYTNIEWECLSVCFGLQKCHTYIYACHIIVHNDHKPLKMIQKPIHAAPLIYNACFSDFKNMITWYSINLAKKWSWQTTSADSPHAKKTCQ